MRSLVRHALDIAVVAMVALLAWFLWPSFLGGTNRVVAVHGHSMEPTFHAGDLVVLNTHAQPAVGRIFVFQIPADEPGGGRLVVHRIIGQRDDGSYITQGDNTQNPDSFRVTDRELVGSPRFVVPHGAKLISIFGTPIGLATATGLLSAIVMWPRARPNTLGGLTRPTIGPDGWSSIKIPEEEMTAAEAWVWVETQLDPWVSGPVAGDVGGESLLEEGEDLVGLGVPTG